MKHSIANNVFSTIFILGFRFSESKTQINVLEYEMNKMDFGVEDIPTAFMKWNDEISVEIVSSAAKCIIDLCKNGASVYIYYYIFKNGNWPRNIYDPIKFAHFFSPHPKCMVENMKRNIQKQQWKGK